MRAIANKTYTLQHNSEEWQAFVGNLQRVTQLELFQATIGDLESNPAQLMIHCILDLSRVLQSSDLPDTERGQELFFVKHFGEREDGYEVLNNFSKNFKGFTPFVNLYVILCYSCLGWIGSKVPVDDALTKLNLAMFLQRSLHKNRLGARNQPSDSQVISCILMLRLASKLNAEKRVETI